MWIRLPKLWQRMFLYVLLLVMASHAVSLLIFKVSIDKYEVRHFLALLSADIAESLEFYDSHQLEALSEFFRVFPHDLWIEKPDGSRLAGEPPPGFDVESRRKMYVLRVPESAVTLFETRTGSRYMARVPLTLLEGPAYMCLLLGERPPPALYGIFMQSAFAVLLLGVVLSLWLALKFARPLWLLREEVLDIAEGNLKRRVTVQGSYEVAQVARAVNRLAANLSQNIDGMRLLLANLSHELRSPLARMNVSAVIVEEQLFPPHEHTMLDMAQDAHPMGRNERILALKHIRSLQREMDLLAKLIGQTLLSSKLDLGEKKLRREPVEFSLLLTELCQRHEDLMRSRELEFACDIKPNLWVEGDEDLLFQMISNLLDNAVKYTEQGGFVHIRLDESAGLVRLVCENAHQPLEEEVLAQIFEPYYRAGLATGDGVGLGLSLVEKIAKNHHGRVFVANGDASVLFTVELPLTRQPLA